MHKLSLLGGAHEGLQHLGPYGNIPNIVAELTGDNVPKDFSEDQGYPDPPNPCPIGKTGNSAAALVPLSSLYIFQPFSTVQPLVSNGGFFHSLPREKNCWEIGCFSVSDEGLFFFFLLIYAPSVLLYDSWKRSPGRNHLDLRLADSDIYESILFLREFIFKLAPKKVILYRWDLPLF